MTGVKMLAFVGFILMAAGLINGYQTNRDMESKMKRLVDATRSRMPYLSDDRQFSVDSLSYDHKGLTMQMRTLFDTEGISPHRLKVELRSRGRLPLCDHPGMMALLEMGAELRLEISNREKQKLLTITLDQTHCSAA